MLPRKRQVFITEVGPRDGFQAEQRILPTELKLQCVLALFRAGLDQIQVTSFVNPKKVPQLADAEEVVSVLLEEGLQDNILALILNSKGLRRALDAGLHQVEISISACPVHGQKNTGLNFREACLELERMLDLAKKNNLQVRGSIQCAFGSPYLQERSRENVLFLLELFQKYGVSELMLADTAALATPALVREVLTEAWACVQEVQGLGLHLHDHLGLGLVNVYVALDMGVRRFDASFAGLGGCPFLSGSQANVATEKVVNLCSALGLQTGVNLELLRECIASWYTFF